MIAPEATFFFPGLARYLENAVAGIEGWLSPTTAMMTAQLLVQQSRAGLRGDVAEIGVHHGKYFLVLANATLPGERAVAVDVFDDQHKNLDASGRGDRAIFEHHLAAHAPGVEVEILQESSLDLDREGFLAPRFRFLSIDGGHTAAVVASDLRLAERTLLPHGVAALDDVLSHNWTGVLTGLNAYLIGGGTLTPMAMLPNKLLLSTDAAAAQQGRALLRRDFPGVLAKAGLEFLDGTIDSYNEDPLLGRETAASLRLQLAAAQDSHRALEAELAAARREADALRASTSWRLTAPWRRLAQVAGDIAGHRHRTR